MTNLGGPSQSVASSTTSRDSQSDKRRASSAFSSTSSASSGFKKLVDSAGQQFKSILGKKRPRSDMESDTSSIRSSDDEEREIKPIKRPRFSFTKKKTPPTTPLTTPPLSHQSSVRTLLGKVSNRSMSSAYASTLVAPSSQDKPLPPIYDPKVTYDRIVVFGDSLSDTGRHYYESDKFWPNKAYYTSPKVPGAIPVYGRFTNGPNWVDTLREDMPNMRIESYAWGGATSGRMGAASRNKVRGQIRESRNTVDQVNHFIASTPRSEIQKAIAILWIGSNDLLHSAKREGENPLNFGNILRQTLQNLQVMVEMLAKAGCDNIVVLGIPQFKHLPAMSIRKALFKQKVHKKLSNPPPQYLSSVPVPIPAPVPALVPAPATVAVAVAAPVPAQVQASAPARRIRVDSGVSFGESNKANGDDDNNDDVDDSDYTLNDASARAGDNIPKMKEAEPAKETINLGQDDDETTPLLAAHRLTRTDSQMSSSALSETESTKAANRMWAIVKPMIQKSGDFLGKVLANLTINAGFNGLTSLVTNAIGKYNDNVQMWVTLVREEQTQKRLNGDPFFRLTYVDINAKYESMTQDARVKNGPCLVSSDKNESPDGQMGGTLKLCSDPENRFFFDTVHPMSWVHRELAKFVEMRMRDDGVTHNIIPTPGSKPVDDDTFSISSGSFMD
ncbi:hypothetical protein H4R33_001125 [Dimargaris cristalligena]|nr:hypothetical protein H4R33_001125 [Dimargaris cristalligena]